MKTRENMRCLLVQARDDEPTKEEELREFVTSSGFAREQFEVLNIFETADFVPELVERFDVVFVGGSSSEGDDVLEWKKPYVRNTGALLARAYERRIPTFASCLGFQVAAIALGGTLIADKEHMEMGSYAIYRTPEGIRDTLFADMSDGFLAISGHAKRVNALPPGAVLLCYSDLCPIHAFKMEDAPFYATQFHPEVTLEDLRTRLERYKTIYLDSDAELERILNETQPTPEANALIGRFVERIVFGG